MSLCDLIVIAFSSFIAINAKGKPHLYLIPRSISRSRTGLRERRRRSVCLDRSWYNRSFPFANSMSLYLWP
ncbi:hypothetical protein XELAEV_18035763mg [Xenopus laevis]|uniref:Uncharacterized protein n=1 Tax=Xenopus laevis TaxID=8355 RepID=A0A974HCT7_XENLA|nr:hypothetical protein XELAEV_18035763mg [Xenopus laevis]